MKKIYPLSILFLSILLISGTLHAQRTIDAKKKKNVPVDASVLHAKTVRGVSSKNARSASPVFRQGGVFSHPATSRQPHRIVYSAETALPAFIETKRDHTSSQVFVRKDIASGCYDYLKELGTLLHIEKPDSDFVIQHTRTDKDNKTHVRLEQFYKNIPVYGAEVIVHLNEFGEGEAFNGNYLTLEKDIDVTPNVSAVAAVEKVKSLLIKETHGRPLTSLERKLVQYEEPQQALCIYQDNRLIKTHVLAYHVVYCPSVHARWEYFVDAHTGNVLHHFNSTCFADGPRTASANDLNGVSRTVNTYQKGTTFFMLDASRPMFDEGHSVLPDEPVGGILTIDMNNTFGDNAAFQHVTSATNAWTNTRAVSAHFNGGVAYEYYRTNHDRNSIDGSGGTIISVINVTDEEGGLLDNAFWNGKAMFYGNGNIGFKPLAGAIDVAGHEMTHGVVQNTANLEYQGESGAINESLADIFGSMMDPTDWLIGEDVVKAAAFPSGALRSMSDPHNGGNDLGDPGFQPKHVNEMYEGAEDNGGVHINSGIVNHAFFKYAEAITRDKAADVFYKALADYLTKSSKFIDLRLAVIKAAGDLFGTASNEVTQAGIAFDAVGIGTGQGGDYEENLPTNPGTEYLLVYSTNLSDANTLYRAEISGSSAEPLTTTSFNSRPSVTDDGTAAVFVADDHTIHVITTEPGSDPEEYTLQDEAIWSNVVISKGGNRMAAVTTEWDNMIYVYDFVSEEWTEFELYNPTYSEGVNSGGTVYADALEFDYTGEFLVYDCFNRLDNSTGTDIEYWDVNFIRVWDKSINDFGDGTIEKLFSSLPEGVSIGNPSFAKNTPNVIAFDYVDELNEEYAVLGCNIETNEVNVIVSNNGLGWPSFNKNDTRIAFTYDNEGEYETGYVTLNSDKISSNGSVSTLFIQTMWPVYFATGDRVIGDDEVTGIPEETERVSLTCYPNPFVDEVSLKLKNGFVRDGRIEVSNLLGQRLYNFEVRASNEETVALKISGLPPGQYILKMKTSNAVGVCSLQKR